MSNYLNPSSSAKIRKIKSLLKLKLHPREGGYFAETYRSREFLPAENLPGRYKGKRRFSTAIYYLFTRDSISLMHRLRSDEIFHFYGGDPVEMLVIGPKGKGKIIILGSNLHRGESPQVVIPRGFWQGSRLKPRGSYALLGTTVAPGFEYADYEHGKQAMLLNKYPRFKKTILSLTR